MRDRSIPDPDRKRGFVEKRNPLKVIGEQTIREYRRTDPTLDFAVQSLSPQPPCKKGCAACCKQLVSTSMAEVAAIAVAYPDKLRAKRKKLREQADLLASLVEQVFGTAQRSYSIDTEEASADYSQKNERLADLWWAEQLACVFLREDNTCSVYDARPISCRGYYVRTDPALCFSMDKPEVELYSFHAIQFLRLRLMEQSGGNLTLMYLPTALWAGLKAL